jgi:hypothetical protein
MAHFARVENNIVTEVLVIPDSQEDRGNEYLSLDLGLGGSWYKTSYNTIGGVHTLGGTPYRKNYAGIGYTFDSNRQAFIAPKPFASWVLDEETCLWESPVAYPTDDQAYTWDENTTSWVLVTE